MSVIRWPEPFNERLVESKVYKAMGKSALARLSSRCRRRHASSRSRLYKRGYLEINIAVLKRFLVLLIGSLLVTIAGCSDGNESNPSDVSGYNYTDYYIAEFRVGSEGDEFPAGGPNIFPKKDGQARSGGGKFMCCISIPAHWRPGMKLVVKWNVDKALDGKHLGTWYTATAEVPPYGPRTAGFVVHFLSGDRIRIQIRDEKGILPKIDDDDPYIVQGVLDPELNKKRGASDERHSMA